MEVLRIDTNGESTIVEMDVIQSSTTDNDGSKLLQMTIEKKLQDIADYDSSDAVNSFTYNGIALWFSAEVRAGFKNSIESASLLGETTISIPTTAGVINLPLNDAKIMLAKIQRYADACFLVTQQHKIAVNSLTTIEAVENFDYKTGYPEKLKF